MKEKLKALFASNTEKNEAHYTSDGCMFWDKNHATAHAKAADFPGPNREVVTVTRAEAEREETDEDRLVAIQARKTELMNLLEPYKAEWDALSEQEDDLLHRLGKNRDEEESDLERKLREAAEASAKATAEQQAAEEAEAKAKAEAEAAAKGKADADSKEAEGKAAAEKTPTKNAKK